MTSSLRDVLTVRVEFPTFSERLACEPEAPGVVRLLEFSDLIALAPGDVLAVNQDGRATEVIATADGWLVRAHFKMGTDQDVVEATARIWERATRVHPGMLTVDVLTESREWIEDIVATNPLIEFVDIVRKPGDQVDLSTAVQDG